MKEPIRILKNTLALVGGNVIEKIIGFLLIILIARYLGDEGLGKYSFAFAFIGVFYILTDLGLETWATREIAKKKKGFGELINALFSLKSIFSTALFLIVAPSAFYISKNDTVMLMIISLAGMAMLFDAMRFSITALFIAMEDAELLTATLITERLISLFLAIILMPRWGIYGLMIGLVLSYFSGFVTAYLLTWKKYKFAPRLHIRSHIKTYKNYIKKAIPFWLTAVFSFIYFRLDTLMLGYMQNYEVVGWYNAAYSLVLGISFIPGAFVSAIYPVMSRYHVKRKKELLKNLANRVVYYMLVLAVPLAVGTTILARRIIQFVFKEQFMPHGAIALQILIWSAMFFFINSILGYTLNSIDRQTRFTLATGISALLNIILNLLLIPKYSYLGAGIATVTTFFVITLLLQRECQNAGYNVLLTKMVLRPVVAAILMGFVTLKLLSLHVVINALISMGLYFLVLAGIGGIGKKELSLAQDLAAHFKGKLK